MSQPSLVLQGNLDEISVDEVLSTISLSRSCLRVEFDDEEAATIVVKAGNVLHAAGGSSPAGVPAFQALRRRDAGGFRVYRQPFDAHNSAPLGTLGELLGEPAPKVEEGFQAILAGPNVDGALVDVLGVMSLSRQRLELRLYRADGSVGFVRSKAGLVVEARIEPSGLKERAALLAMMRVPTSRFELSRVSPEGTLPRPFGGLAELRRASGASDGAPGPRVRHRSVIRGDFEQYGFLDVLAIVTASRQVLEITLTNQGSWRGMVLVKAGQLLDARTEAGDQGVRALYALIAEPGDAFDAVLSQRTKLPATPLGDLRTLTSAAAQGAQEREVSDQGARDASPVRPPPVVSIAPPVVAAPPPPRLSSAPEQPTMTDEEVTAVGPVTTPPVSPSAAELTHLARGIGRIEQQLARQDTLIERALANGGAQQASAGSRSLLLLVLGAQGLVGVLLVALIAAIALS